MRPYEIVRREDFSDVTYLLEVSQPEMARAAHPGQFVIVMSHAEGERIPLTIADQDPELGAAVAFLRGTMPDEHLDAWLKSNSDVGWKGVTRDEFVTMIRASALRSRVSATEELERARTAHLSAPGRDATLQKVTQKKGHQSS